MFVDRISVHDSPESDGYPFDIPAVAALVSKGIEMTSPVTFFVGENGSGKSTLIEAIAVACGFNPEGGTRNFSFSTADTHSELSRFLRVSRRNNPKDGFFLRAESFYNAISYMNEINDLSISGPPLVESYGGVPLHERSHGEGFMALVRNRFGGEGLYVLDEPEAALSPQRQLTLLCEIKRLVDDGSQFIVATHSPILIAYPGASVLELSERGIERVPYDETSLFRTVRDFISDPERMIHYLFS